MTENGERGMGNGERGIGNGERTVTTNRYGLLPLPADDCYCILSLPTAPASSLFIVNYSLPIGGGSAVPAANCYCLLLLSPLKKRKPVYQLITYLLVLKPLHRKACVTITLQNYSCGNCHIVPLYIFVSNF
jgi:hypothetical protein